MKTSLSLMFIFLSVAFTASGQQHPTDFVPQQGPPPVESKPLPNRAMMVKYMLIMPSDKTSERVKEGERNPFGKNGDDNGNIIVKGQNEENIIRDQLIKLRASGASFENDDTRVMLGDMILRPGQFLPPVLPHQTLLLRVAKIRRDAIELQWVEKKYSGLPPRVLTIPMDLRPVVHYKLQGQAGREVASAPGGVPEGSSKTMMGEQYRPALQEDPPEVEDGKAAPKNKVGDAGRIDADVAKLVDEAPKSRAGAKNKTPAPSLPEVNLEGGSGFTPLRSASGTAAAAMVKQMPRIVSYDTKPQEPQSK